MCKAKFLRYLILCLFSSLAVNHSAYANLSVKPIIMEFTDGENNRRDMTVKNNGKYTQYLEISPMRITNPGSQPEIYSEPKDPEKLGLLVAPRRLILKPGEEKIIRVIRIEKQLQADDAWRVHIRPAKTKIETDSTALMTQVAYKALVFARPMNKQVALNYFRDKRQLQIRNTGNTNIMLHDGKQCREKNQKDCVPVSGKRLWPGNTWVVTLPTNNSVEFKTYGHLGDSVANFK